MTDKQNLNATSPPLTSEQKYQEKLEYITHLNYTRLCKSIVQDLISNKKESVIFQKYPKDKVIKFLSNPQQYEKQIRSMSMFLYENSNHYKRLCEYFAKLSTLDYIIVPYNMPKKYNKNSYLTNYYKVVNNLEKMNLKHELSKILDICWYQDIFAGLYFETQDSFTIVHINADYVRISSTIDGCLTYSLNMDYFNNRQYLLDSYGDEIKKMYCDYAGYQEIKSNGKKGKKIKGNRNLRWQEPKNQICFKVNENQLLYSLPPFASIFPDILNIDDYKTLKKTGEFLDHYKILTLEIPLDDEGNFKLDKGICDEYYNQICSNVSQNVGVIQTPMKIDSVSFQNPSKAEHNAITDAESCMYSAVGSSQMLFGGGSNPSSSSLELSTKNDEVIAFSLIRQAERWINKYIKQMNLPYDFKIKFLETTIFNRQKMFDLYYKAGQSGVPCKMALGATIGYSPSDILNMGTLENEILQLRDTIYNEPLLSSNTMSSDKDGRPTNASKGEQLSDSGEQTLENDENDNK